MGRGVLVLEKKFHEIYKNHFFDGLIEDELRSVDLNLFKEKTYKTGELLIKQDTAGNFMFLIVTGEVVISKVIDASEIELARRKSGDYVGEMALFDGQLRSANVVASSDVNGYIIDVDLFFYLFRNFEQIKINIIKIINSTVRDTGVKLGESSITHDRQLSIKDSELIKTRSLLNETIELKRYIDEQKCELELINSQLEKRNKELYQLTIKDDLTHLYSHNHFTTLMESEFSRSLRYNMIFSLLIIDMDNFSDFNKRYGHFTGDRILKEMAGIISSLARTEDVVGRIDGEKFGIILPHQSIQDAELLSITILKEIEESIYMFNGENRGLTVSIGISDNVTGSPDSCKKLMEQAELAMKKAKDNGRNRYEIYSALLS